MGKIKQIWNKLGTDIKQWMILFLVSIEASLFYRFLIPIETKSEYGTSVVHIINLLVHWLIFIPILNRFLLKDK